MLALAWRSWRHGFLAARAMPDTFVSSGVAVCLLLGGQLWLAGQTPDRTAALALLLASALLRPVFVAPWGWAVHRHVLLGERWNEIALPVRPDQRRLLAWMAALAALPAAAGLVAALPHGLSLYFSTALLLAGGAFGARLGLTGPAMALGRAAPLRDAWAATRQHAWFAAGSFALTMLPLALLALAGGVPWQRDGSLAGLALLGSAVVAAPAVISAWQAGLYALLRGAGAAPAAQPEPAPEPALLRLVWQGWHLAAAAARDSRLLLPVALGLAAAGNWLVLHYIIQQHLEMGRSGSLLQDFGWRGVAWIGCIRVMSLVLGTYASAAVACAVLRHALLGEAVSLAVFYPSRRLGAVALWLLLAPVLIFYAPAVALGFFQALRLTIGDVSAALTLLLVLPPAVAGCLALLRLALLPAVLALGHRFALAESFAVSRFHVWLMAATLLLAMAPSGIGVALLADHAPIGPFARLVLLLPAGSVLTTLLGSGMMAALYQRLAGTPEQERPSRDPVRRREPALARAPLAE